MFSGRKTKEFYIDLQDSRYYNPGEVVRGDVVLDVTKPTKINHIKIALSGTVHVGSNVLTLFTREDEIASEPNGSHLLEAKSNRFPFELNIPGASAELPTSMKLGDGSSHISYTILATLKRPFVPAPLAPEDTREISVVERIDVSNPEYDHPVPENEEDDKVMVDGTSLGITIPKAAYVRGDIMPVTIKVACAEDFGKADAIRVALVRRFHLFGKGR
ncbi:hypothetical protein K492DRAFT_237903 [Lichtheimia hyalospora FSU 10163]|nr:hypothetical protein K492DRAFT_237903 [Lichtheimia hyalospora FSU 10163]